MIFIGPPFGNYISLPNTISIRGSYTLEPRPGLLKQIFKTLHYSCQHQGWINKIGLRNPGIDYAIEQWKETNDSNKQQEKTVIYSIAILDKNEVPILVKKIPTSMDIELNVSCPNAEKHMVTEGLGRFICSDRTWCIIKLSPKADKELIDGFYREGFRQFHCSNTLPTKKGGLSGPTLRPYTNNLVTYIKKKYPDTLVIAGGGIQSMEDIENYRKVGADHFAMSTVFFNPFKTFGLFYDFYTKK